MKKLSAILAAVSVLAIGAGVAGAQAKKKGEKARQCRENYPQAVCVWKRCFKASLLPLIRGKSPEEKAKVKEGNDWKAAYKDCHQQFKTKCKGCRANATSEASCKKSEGEECETKQ